MEKSNKNATEGKKGIKKYIPLIIVVIVVLTACWYWYKDYSKYISTDDAYIDSDKVSIGSKILGRVSKIYANEGDSVNQGMLLAELDSAELFAQKNQIIAQKNQAIANHSQVEAKYQFDQESIKVQEINLQRAKEDLDRAKLQFDGGVMTKEQYDHSIKNYESAKAVYESAKTQLAVSRSQISTAQTAVSTADAQIGVTMVQLRNTKLYAPISGVLARRWLLPGDISQPGQSIFTVLNDREQWVSIYLEESKLGYIKIGQHATFKVDAFPDYTFSGKVFYIASNTASQFSLIPPSNASGNFTKITQRVALKVSIDEVKDSEGKQVNAKLLSGMSAVVKIVK